MFSNETLTISWLLGPFVTRPKINGEQPRLLLCLVYCWEKYRLHFSATSIQHSISCTRGPSFFLLKHLAVSSLNLRFKVEKFRSKMFFALVDYPSRHKKDRLSKKKNPLKLVSYVWIRHSYYVFVMSSMYSPTTIDVFLCSLHFLWALKFFPVETVKPTTG